MDSKSIGVIIAKLRKKNGMTQSSLAKQLAVTDKAVSRWENGQGFPDITIFPRLAELFGVSIDYLMLGEKRGITVAGNMLLDIVKSIAEYPKCGRLSYVSDISYAVGGCAPNTAIDLAKIDPTVFDMIEGEIIRYVPSMKGISRHIRSIIEELSDVEMVVCGESNLLQYPEFYDVARLRRFYDIIADRHNFNKMVVLPQDGNIQVSIDPEFFPNASLITASLGDVGTGNTSISVIGPTRMNYQRILSDMKYFSYIISKLMLGDGQEKKENYHGE
jgi:transcriptional regulator with XRE-family HTH domain